MESCLIGTDTTSTYICLVKLIRRIIIFIFFLFQFLIINNDEETTFDIFMPFFQ